MKLYTDLACTHDRQTNGVTQALKSVSLSDNILRPPPLQRQGSILCTHLKLFLLRPLLLWEHHSPAMITHNVETSFPQTEMIKVDFPATITTASL